MRILLEPNQDVSTQGEGCVQPFVESRKDHTTWEDSVDLKAS